MPHTAMKWDPETDFAERRSNPRAKQTAYDCVITDIDFGGRSKARVLDISFDGMGLKVQKKLETNSLIEIFIPNASNLTIRAVVQWCKRNGSSEQYMIGVSFVSDPSRLLALINK